MFVHFTGRVRGAADPVPDGLPSTAEARLVKILEDGFLLASTRFTYRPAVCVSESTRTAAKAFFLTGVNSRGPYDPWGLLLDRDACIASKFRPVIPASDLEITALKFQAEGDIRVEGLLGRAIRYAPQEKGPQADWLHEREWRRPFLQSVGAEEQRVNLKGLVAGIITGSSAWEPPSDRRYAIDDVALKRYWWDGSELVKESILELRSL